MRAKVEYVLKKILNEGYEAYIVGGAVRDIILNKNPQDFDVCTNAKPNTIIELFKSHDMYTSGLKHGTVTIIIDGTPIEITTYRKDGDYLDNRHPSDVYFSDNVLDDLSRRDFTINALLMDVNGKIIDLIGGVKDIENGTIRSIGDPQKRFSEDVLRVMRAIRFKAQLGFEIEENTEIALYKMAPLLVNISKERKADEILKIIKASNLEVLNEYRDILNIYINYGNDIDLLYKTDDLILRLAILFKDNQDELNKLFLNKKIIKVVKYLINNRDYQDRLTYILSNIEDPNLFIEYIKILDGKDLRFEYDKLKDYIVNLKTLDIKSRELIKLGYKGKELGEIKRKLINDIQDKKLKNTHSSILYWIKCYNL